MNAAPDRPRSRVDIEELRVLTAVVRKTGPEIGMLGASIAIGLFGFGFIVGPDLVKHWPHWPLQDVIALIGLCVVILVGCFRSTLTYQFDNGVLRCSWFGKMLWQEDLMRLRFVEARHTRGGSFLIFVWDDRRRSVYLSTYNFSRLGVATDDED